VTRGSRKSALVGMAGVCLDICAAVVLTGWDFIEESWLTARLRVSDLLSDVSRDKKSKPRSDRKIKDQAGTT
jgi:hypothetical protein